jgi:hypothetical protein
MSTVNTMIDSLYEKAEAYGKTTILIAKLKALEVTTVVVSRLAKSLAIVMALIMFLLVFNLGIAIWIGELLGKYYLGFFIVAAFYLLLAIVVNLFLHSWIKKSITRFIIINALD